MDDMVTCTGHIGIHEGADGRRYGRKMMSWLFYQIFSHRWVTSIFLAMVLCARSSAIKEQLSYHLRSASGLTLKYPILKLKKTLGDRAFSSMAPNLWNSLLLHIRLVDNFERFKSLLKTHLFKLAFDM